MFEKVWKYFLVTMFAMSCVTFMAGCEGETEPDGDVDVTESIEETGENIEEGAEDVGEEIEEEVEEGT